MDEHKELEACSVTTSAWAKQGLLATLLAQGVIGGATISSECAARELGQRAVAPWPGRRQSCRTGSVTI
eukprot:5521132-Pyramimonas_sp.AAC.1